MTAEEARLQIFYSGWASRKLLDAALALSEEEQHRDFGVSHKSLIGTLEHIFFADRIWLARTVDPGAARQHHEVILGAFAEFSPGETLTTEWPELQKRWEDWAAGLSDQEIVRVIDYKDLKGYLHRAPVWQIVLHVVNHATLHRGQAMSLLRQLGVAPPPTDLIYYYREIKAK
jgi:uncharacterized damage-inducible protein DinB